MAQRETGLGWSAKEEWLVFTNPTIAEIHVIGGSQYPGQPIPKNMTSPGEILQNGFHMCDITIYSRVYSYYCAANSDSDVLVAVVTRTGWLDYHFISTTSAQITIVDKAPGFDPSDRTFTLTTQDGVTGFYYGRYSVSTGDAADNYAPAFASVRDALDAVQIVIQPYMKLNPGPAVACLAEWYTPEGADLISPVLISTVPESTVLTTDGTTPADGMTTFDFLYQGARFYMTIIAGNTSPMVTTMETADLRQFGASFPSKVFSLIAAETFSNIIVNSAPDPYEDQAGASTEEGGEGEDQDDDPVEEETLPVPSVAGLGFCKIYVPSLQELGQMASYLWSGAFDVDQVIKLFSNPMDSILGLSAVPVSLTGTPEQIYLGGVALPNITMPKYTGRTSVKVDFGTTTIKERWGSYLDYEPYTEFSIYLPFIGIKPLKADDIMGKTISLMYDIDILSGGCVAYIRPTGGSVLYEWSGQCALQIPVTARNYDNVFQTAMSVVGAVGAAVVAPASAPVLSGAVASAAVQAAATKPRIERSGSVNGITGFLGQLRPYIIRTIPEAFIPADQNKFIGYPAYINVALSEIRGYNEVDSIHLENVPATGAELEEIESVLKGGVIF